jgi:hypothetical protein
VSDKVPLVVEELSSDKLTWSGNLFYGGEVKAAIMALNSDPRLKMVDGIRIPDSAGPVANAAAKIPISIETDIEGQKRPNEGADVGANEVKGGEGEISLPPLEPNDVGVNFLKVQKRAGRD